ncbi:MAG: hypothetical protein GX122_08685 [Candidatus Cloacimonetes bacterium]|nr:hypothetical protein [Candidatus Cloacimonadota bacterium]
MNLRIEFYQGNTGAENYNQTLHTITDPHSLTLSKLSLQSVSNYTREPRRCVFSMYLDDFLRDCVLNPDHEHTRYISHYEVRIFQDDALIFTGIIDTSATNHDLSTDVVKITAYDKIKLLATFSDLEQYYSLSAGYYPVWILMYYAQNIQHTIPVHIPVSASFTPPQINLDSGEAILLHRIEFGELFTVPPPSGQWTYSVDATAAPHFGNFFYGYRMDAPNGQATFIFFCRSVLKRVSAHFAPLWQARHQVTIIRILNGVCPVRFDYRHDTNWEETMPEPEDTASEVEGFFTSHGVAMPTQPLPLSVSNSHLTYTTGMEDPSGIFSGNWPPNNLDRLWLEVCAHGNVLPPRILPGKAYEEYSDTKTNTLNALQAALMLYNATIVAAPDGTLSMLPKERLSTSTTNIDSDDVISITQKRENAQEPDTKTLDILAGDTAILQTLVKKHLMQFFTHRTRIDVTIDKISKYPLDLTSQIRIQNTNYLVTEVTPDFIKDNQKVTAWQI